MSINSFNYMPLQSQLQLAMGSVDPILSERVSLVEVENANGQKICKIKADLSNLDFLKSVPVGNENTNNAQVAMLIDKIVGLGSKLSIYGIAGLQIAELNLSHTNVSSRSVIGKFTMQNEKLLMMPELLKSLTNLDLSHTQTSDSILPHLHHLTALRELSLDGCAVSQVFPKSKGSNTLQKINWKGAGFFSAAYLQELQSSFPSSKITTE